MSHHVLVFQATCAVDLQRKIVAEVDGRELVFPPSITSDGPLYAIVVVKNKVSDHQKAILPSEPGGDAHEC